MKKNTHPSNQVILIADDNLVVLRLIQEHLSHSGYQVHTANTGEKALAALPLVRPDLVLLDVDMPGISGFEVCRIIKQNPVTADIPILFVTACTDRKDILAGFAAGGQDYILKPFIKEELLARVQTHLALRAAQQELKANVMRYRELSVRDDLTGLFNTRYLYQTLQAQLDNPHSHPLTVVFIDIDKFKVVVDTYGHLNASSTIAELAETIIPLLPKDCYGVSYGGDEFVVVLANHDREQGLLIAEQIRQAIEHAVFLVFCDLAIHITVSCGLATFPEDAQTMTALLDNADLALFEAKRRGRNSVISFADTSGAAHIC